MALTLEILTGLLPLAYLAVLVDYGLTFSLRVRTDTRSPWLFVAVLLNAACLGLQAWAGHGPPLGTSATIPGLLALMIAAVYALVEWRTRDRRTGIFVLGVVFLFQYVSTMMFFFNVGAPAGVEEAAGQSLGARLHIVPALLADVALALAAVYGLLYVMVQRGLKQHHFGVLYDRLPSLARLGHMTWHALLTGFVCMTVALGVLLLARDGRLNELTPKLLAKIITGPIAWIIYAVAIYGRFFRKWDSSRISILALLGFAVVLVMLVASAVLS